MTTEELSNRLTQILTGVTNEQPNIIQGFVKNFIEDFKPDYYYEISVTDIEGYTPTFIEYYAWDEDEDGPIPGIKLFKDLNIYLEREYCEYYLILITMETNFEYLAKILKDDAIDTWTLREQEEINKLDLTQGLHIFLYDIYTGVISYCQTNKPTNQEPIYESEHIIILDSDSIIGCQE